MLIEECLRLGVVVGAGHHVQRDRAARSGGRARPASGCGSETGSRPISSRSGRCPWERRSQAGYPGRRRRPRPPPHRLTTPARRPPLPRPTAPGRPPLPAAARHRASRSASGSATSGSSTLTSDSISPSSSSRSSRSICSVRPFWAAGSSRSQPSRSCSWPWRRSSSVRAGGVSAKPVGRPVDPGLGHQRGDVVCRGHVEGGIVNGDIGRRARTAHLLRGLGARWGWHRRPASRASIVEVGAAT